MSNDIYHNKTYDSCVDNVADVKEVRNLMIGPVFGHKTNPFKVLHPEAKEDKKKK